MIPLPSKEGSDLHVFQDDALGNNNRLNQESPVNLIAALDDSFEGELNKSTKTADVSLSSSISIDMTMDTNEVASRDTSSSSLTKPKLSPVNIVSLEDFLEANKNVKRCEGKNLFLNDLKHNL